MLPQRCCQFKIQNLKFNIFLCSCIFLSTPSFAKQAPDFTLSDTSGKKVTLSELKGKVVLINFFASWCAPCRKEIPTLNKWQKTFGPDFVALGIDYDSTTAKEVTKVKKEMGINFTCLVDENKMVQKGYEVWGLPASFLIDADGNLVHRIDGGITGKTETSLEKQIKQLIKQAKAQKNVLTLSVSPFDNLTERARKEKKAQKAEKAVLEFLKTQDNVKLTSSPRFVLSGTVSQFTDEAGVEIKIIETATGTGRGFVITAYVTDRIKEGEMIWKKS